MFQIAYPILDTRISCPVLRPPPSCSGHLPPWNLKRAGLESSGQIASSLYWKTKKIAFFFCEEKKKKDFCVFFFKGFSRFSYFLTILENLWILGVFKDFFGLFKIFWGIFWILFQFFLFFFIFYYCFFGYFWIFLKFDEFFWIFSPHFFWFFGSF